jgi:hypothetical protein
MAAKPKKVEPFEMNAWQKAAARAYEDGEFGYIADRTFKNFDEFRAHLRDTIDDGLFTFIMIELNDSDMDTETAQNRMSKAIDQLNDVFGAVCGVAPTPTPGR